MGILNNTLSIFQRLVLFSSYPERYLMEAYIELGQKNMRLGLHAKKIG